MKKFLSLVVGGVFILLAMGIVNNIGANAQAETERGYISVQGEANEEYTPDMAKITFSVATSNKDISKATEDNKKSAENSINAIKKMIDTNKGEQIKTVSFNVSPEYSYKNSIRTFVQYNARNSFEVTIKDTSKLGKVIQTALSNGANEVSGLSYSLTTNEENCKKLIKEASKTAKDRAISTASAMGTTLNGIKSIDTQCSTNQFYQPRYSMKMMTMSNAEASMDTAGGAVPTEEGTIKLRAYVNASFFVK